LPLGVLAIVKIDTPTRKHNLEYVVTQLLETAKITVPENSNERLDLPQVHAHNILRAIFQDASLAQEVRNYFETALVLVIKSFQSIRFDDFDS
ncbi:hypothetical protein HK096_000416, partial [Nowakowskiella sp. JEL0078]